MHEVNVWHNWLHIHLKFQPSTTDGFTNYVGGYITLIAPKTLIIPLLSIFSVLEDINGHDYSCLFCIYGTRLKL